jgi:hypothetical protein
MSRRLTLLLSAAIACFFVVLFGIRVNRMQVAGKNVDCHGHLTTLALAMHMYHEAYGCLPPAYIEDSAGRKMHSWRILVLAFWDRGLYGEYDFNEPWDGPHNRLLAGRMPSCFACPSDPVAKENGMTNYVVIVGEETAFPGSRTVTLNDIHTDKASTVLIAEVVGANMSWLEPRDLSFTEMSFSLNDRTQPSISSNHLRGPNVSLANGTTATLDCPPEVVRAMVTIAGSEKAITKKAVDR